MENDISLMDLALYIYLRAQEEGKDPVKVGRKVLAKISFSKRLSEFKQALSVVSKYSVDVNFKKYLYAFFQETAIYQIVEEALR